MKKKGLIISTVVMVVVLIASLTTATYAWFAASSTVSVNNLNMQTTAMQGLQVGLAVNDAGDLTSASNYVNGSVTVTGGAWVGNAGLGGSVAFDDTVKMNIENAVTKYVKDDHQAKMATGETAVADDFIVASKYSNTNNDNPDVDEYKNAVKNTNYFDVTLGVRATAEDVNQIYFTITVTFVNSTDGLLADYIPGMAAALHFDLYIDGAATPVSVEAFDGWELDEGVFDGTAAATGKGTSTVDKEAKSATWTYSGFIAQTGITKAIKTLRVVAWIEGNDDACRNSTAGSGAKISVDFGYTSGSESKTISDKGVLSD